jgi:hypothetical protein
MRARGQSIFFYPPARGRASDLLYELVSYGPRRGTASLLVYGCFVTVGWPAAADAAADAVFDAAGARWRPRPWAGARAWARRTQASAWMPMSQQLILLLAAAALGLPSAPHPRAHLAHPGLQHQVRSRATLDSQTQV